MILEQMLALFPLVWFVAYAIFSFSLSGVSNSLAVMLLGRFLVGTGMGLGPPVAALYVTEVYQR